MARFLGYFLGFSFHQFMRLGLLILFDIDIDYTNPLLI
jgi:hypothetical protein